MEETGDLWYNKFVLTNKKKEDDTMIRFAKEADAKALLSIYQHYIDTEITFEYVLPSEREFQERIREVSEEYPYLVYEEEGSILGYAYAHRHLERAAYQWNVELTVYLHPNAVSRGIGRELYERLLGILKEQGICNAYSLITRPNEKSEKLHEAMGFTLLGVLNNTGYKNGKWRDVSWYEKQLNPYAENPVPFTKISDLYEISR